MRIKFFSFFIVNFQLRTNASVFLFVKISNTFYADINPTFKGICYRAPCRYDLEDPKFTIILTFICVVKSPSHSATSDIIKSALLSIPIGRKVKLIDALSGMWRAFVCVVVWDYSERLLSCSVGAPLGHVTSNAVCNWLLRLQLDTPTTKQA